MMKIKGVTYPMSPLKVFLPDRTFDQLAFLTKSWGLGNNAQTLTAIISQYHLAEVAIEKEREEQRMQTAEQKEIDSIRKDVGPTL